MNTHLFGQSSQRSLSCPICSQAQIKKEQLQCSGLVRCKYCHDRIVVSWSGSYVRDPFAFGSLEAQLRLRRQSHPLLRVLPGKQNEWVKFLGGVALVVVLGGGLCRLAAASKTLKSADQPSASIETVNSKPANQQFLPDGHHSTVPLN
jgi:DNA-directed RNA polymerase subunit RPC12/RpoP